jgi:hypothetical protein
MFYMVVYSKLSRKLILKMLAPADLAEPAI